MHVPVGFSVDAICASCCCLDNCVEGGLLHVALTIGIDLLHGSDCVEREGVWPDANDRALQCVSSKFTAISRDGSIVRTILVVILKLD